MSREGTTQAFFCQGCQVGESDELAIKYIFSTL
jgi:hypothetical protein